MTKSYVDILKELHHYCEKENYRGYNMLDSNNSIFPFKKLGHPLSFYINQFFRRSPVNFRPLVGIKKSINPKAIGLFLISYTNLKQLDIIENTKLDELNHRFFNWLANNNSKGYSGYCWGYHYDWPNRDGSVVPAYTPCGVVTSVIIRGIFNYYRIYKDERAKEIIKSSVLFVLKDLQLSETKFGWCFSYTPLKVDLTINASLQAAEILAIDDYLNNKKEHLPLLKGVLEFTKNMQNEDGSWYYSVQKDTFIPSRQIDFHQGNIIDSIDTILKYSDINRDLYQPMLIRGLDFYKVNQFDSNGASYYRIPKKWPVDIHNQAQGIISFCRFSKYHEDYLSFAEKIAHWTFKNLKSKKGNFYYQKWPLLTNKISYIRWNQGWMMVALVELLLILKENENLTNKNIGID